MNILAVTDTESPALENIVSRSPEKLKNVSMIISCGDLDSSYLEFLVDGLNREFFFVCGNHSAKPSGEPDPDSPVERMLEHMRKFHKKDSCYVAGQYDLHGRLVVLGQYILVGFGGSGWYSGRGNEYSEAEMSRVVRKTARKIKMLKFRDKIMGRRQKEIIVVSHAPIFQIHDRPDPCHRGFKCFLDFLNKLTPLLWLHGHIHLRDINKNEISVIGGTTIVNVFGHKFITVNTNKIDVSSRADILDK
ncbi:MAG TPA: hypothetical protein DEE98_04520 [Elusimicrobia bacterium]|nr:MAG: hypothetical protein A2278_04210 [Elusimicrobia bacterium RIFOXYA12_FULL_49_49]OGS10520.1 MAG: hypothetical protein A2386_05460 [Elusimicrobia bacterium RIFOXYB1_FULL_48_9]OGS14745.1 MAG: hypothetical protein A2251_09635 [Elusimicrobia bacterium RIFOXYA2_FULL_47_53]OGS25603.1 MAG: hypothetical protein A2339_05955 [Elusimicrobia bacterium RIFOXYB12_FULL_50_12]OGS31836.1 MAG: hypothetical protein A2323_06545 [Elusimicrobia bacterium RIFOXYB2_FULL_46_23]HBU69630.1 hypothetical protein [El